MQTLDGGQNARHLPLILAGFLRRLRRYLKVAKRRILNLQDGITFPALMPTLWSATRTPGATNLLNERDSFDGNGIFDCSPFSQTQAGIPLKIVPLNFGAQATTRLFPKFACEVQRTRRKTLAIHIKHQKVEVRSPLRTTQREIRVFLESNREWIDQKLRDESQRYRESLRIEKGRKIFYRARELTIVFKESAKSRIVITREQFIIHGPGLTAARAKAQVEAFLTLKASKYLPERARKVAKYLGVGHKLKEVKLRKTKSKWGHCTSTGIIQYNWLIMLAPNSIVDYMIAHEVCHLVHMNHSSRFWNLVETICPQYEYYMGWLKDHEHRFWM